MINDKNVFGKLSSIFLNHGTGLYVVTAYSLMHIFGPIVFQYFFHEDIISIYNPQKINLYSIYYSSFIFFFFFILYSLNRTVFSKSYSFSVDKYCFQILIQYINKRSIFSIFYLGVGLWTFSKGLGDLRYTGISLLNQGNQSFLILIVKMLIYVDLLLILFMKEISETVKFVDTPKVNTMILISHLLLIGGSADTLVFLVMLGNIYFYKIYSFLVFNKLKSKKNIFLSTFKLLSIIILFVPALFIILLFGTALKSNYDLLNIDMHFFLSSFGTIELFFLYLGESFSSHLHSLNYAMTNYSKFNELNFVKILSIPFEVLWYRSNVLIGNSGLLNGLEKPFYGAISQFNFLEVTGHYFDRRQGTSPGVNATFIYLFGIYLGALFSIFYYLTIAKMIDCLCANNNCNSYNLIGAIVLYQLLISFFQSPLDFINIFDNASILFIILIITVRGLDYIQLNKKIELNFEN